MIITATHISYLFTCHRKLWLFANGVWLENVTDNQYVEEVRFIHEHSYTRRPSKWRELDLDNLKIDHFDPGSNTLHR